METLESQHHPKHNESFVNICRKTESIKHIVGEIVQKIPTQRIMDVAKILLLRQKDKIVSGSLRQRKKFEFVSNDQLARMLNILAFRAIFLFESMQDGY